MDPFSRLLMFNPPEGTVDHDCHFRGDWQLPQPPGDLSIIRWHAIETGSAWLDTPEEPPRLLSASSLVLLPHNSAHRLRQYNMADTHIVCGSIRMPVSAKHLLASLPEVLLITAEPKEGETLQLWRMVEFLQMEFISASPGIEALRSFNSAILFTLVIRHWLSNTPPEAGFFNVILHPRLGKAIVQMLSSPAHPWTVEELAQQAHMSRASFAQLFKEVANTTPLLLLTSIRMQMAAQMLARQSETMIAIAEQAGYASESSFYKAFTRHFGFTPGEYRQKTRELTSIR